MSKRLFVDSVPTVSVTFIVNYFFFFQAEDGIRDDLVTGVQTCALPICRWDGTDGPHPGQCGRSSCAIAGGPFAGDRKSTRLNSSHQIISYAVFCLKKKKRTEKPKRATDLTRLSALSIFARRPDPTPERH